MKTKDKKFHFLSARPFGKLDLELARLGLFITSIIAEHDLAAGIFRAHEWALNFQAADTTSAWFLGIYLTIIAVAVFKGSIFYLTKISCAEVRIVRAITSRYAIKIERKKP